MKFLITGAEGQLGREWVRFLSKQKAAFRAFGSAEFDITDSDFVLKKMQKLRPEIVINCAAYTRVDDAEENIERAYLVNKTGVETLAKGCENCGAKLVHYSTDYVFSGDKKDEAKYPEGYPEEAMTSPVNAYGKTKRAGEQVLEESSIEWLLIRVAWLCGEFGSNFVKTMIKYSNIKDSFQVVNDQVGCPSFAFDVVEKTFALAEAGKTGIYHITAKGKLNWAEFAREIFRITGQPVRVDDISSSQFPVKARRPSFSLLSTRKMQEEGLKPISFEEGLEKLVRQLTQDS